jgi:iron complex transport system substrate-binding protein
VPEQIRRAGGWEILADDGEPARATTWQAVAEVDPEMLLLVPCGLHLSDAVRAWRTSPRPRDWSEISAVRRGQVFALDASSYFSRPGPRVIDGIEILAEIFDPAAFVDLAPAGSWVPVQ